MDDRPLFVDISDLLGSLPSSDADDHVEGFAGWKAREPVSMTIFWDDNRPLCGVCQQRFAAPPEGVPIVSGPGSFRIQACPACAVAAVSDR